jgi:N6-adenosine-specific RNA methylase IME4
MANELVIRGKPTTTSLTLPKNITDEEWLEVGATLGKFEQSKMWWVGDWLKHKYPGGYVERGVYDELEEQTGLERQTMQVALSTCKSIDSLIRIKELTFLHHRIVAPLPEPEQKEWLRKAVREDWTVRELRDAIRGSKTPELPDEKYRVIYADPPWEYGVGEQDGERDEVHYPRMSNEHIVSLKVGEIAAPSSVLWLWATSPNIQMALHLSATWGFEYKAMFVWDKVKHNVGYYNSVRHELLLICTRGSCLPDNKELHDSVVSIERTEHSEKPIYFRELIDKMYSKGKRIILFARAREVCEGWDVWGNEV